MYKSVLHIETYFIYSYELIFEFKGCSSSSKFQSYKIITYKLTSILCVKNKVFKIRPIHEYIR